MQSFLAIALLCALVTANPFVPEKRQQGTDDDQFSSAAYHLISVYIPPSASVPINDAIQSAAAESGITGDPNSIFQSALTATSPPAFLTAVPSQYQPNIQSLESAIGELRGAADTGIPGAPRVITSTNDEGSEVVTTQPPGSTSTEAPVTTTDSDGNTITSVASSLSGASASASEALASASASATGAIASASSSLSGTLNSASASGSSASAAASSSIAAASSSIAAASSSAEASASRASASAAPNASSSGFAVPTKAPLVGAGVVGFVGFLAVL